MNLSVSPFSPVSTGEAGTDRREEAVQAARSFESFFVASVFESFFASIPKSDFLEGGPGGDLYQSLFVQEVASQAVLGRGLGLADQIAKSYPETSGKIGELIEKKI